MTDIRFTTLFVVSATLAMSGCDVGPMSPGSSGTDTPVQEVVSDNLPDAQRLQGAWNLAACYWDDGTADLLPNPASSTSSLVFSGDRLTRYSKGELSKHTTHATFQLDESSQPKELDWFTHGVIDGEERTVVIKCIYRLEGDQLHLCFEKGPEYPRPTQFEGRTGQAYFIYQRN